MSPIAGAARGRRRHTAGRRYHYAQGDQRFTVTSKTTSLIGALDAVVRAHGAMQWEIMYCRLDVRVGNARLKLSTTDRSGLGAPFYEVGADGRRVSGCVPGPQ